MQPALRHISIQSHRHVPYKSEMIYLSSKRLLSGFFVMVAFAILVSLGIWQLQRKAWKEALIADIQNRAHGEALIIKDQSFWARWLPSEDEFRHVAVSGTFLYDKEIKVYGLLPSSQLGAEADYGTLQGAYLFTPLQLADSSIIFVNRGFVPKEYPITTPQQSAPVRIEGILRVPEQRGWFVPANDPAKGQWFTRDSNAMATALDMINYAPFYIEADADQHSAAWLWPRAGVTRTIVLKNDHLQYALTWFGLALTLLGVTGYALLRK